MTLSQVVDGVTDLDSALFNPIIDAVNGKGTNGTYNVLAYGAVGDGVTDDTAAFQAAIDAAEAAGGGTVVGGGGTHIVSQVLVGDGITLNLGTMTLCRTGNTATGDTGATIRNRDQSGGNAGITIRGGYIYTADSRDTGRHLGLERVSNFRLDDLWFGQSYGDWHAALNRCSDGTVGSVRINGGSGVGDDGFHMTGGCQRIAVDSIVGSTTDDLLSITQLPTSTRANEDITVRSVMGTSDHNLAKIWIDEYATQLTRRVYVGSVIGTMGAGLGVQITDESDGDRITDISIGSIKLDCSDNDGYGVWVEYAQRVDIASVAVYAPSSFGVYVVNCDDVIVNGAQVSGTRGTTQSGISVLTSVNVTIDRALVDTSTLHGISFQGITHGKIARSTSRGNPGSGIIVWDSSGVVVEGNICHNNTSYGVEEYDSGDAVTDYNLVVGNDLRGNASANYIVGAHSSAANNL